MRLSQSLIALAFSLAAVSSCFGQVQHRGMSPEQEFLVCAQKVLGKPVLWQDIFDGPRNSNRAPRITCPAGRNEFIAALRKDEAITVYEDEQFAFLVTTGYSPLRKPNTFYDYKFDKIPIKLKVSQRERPGSRQLSEHEVQNVTAEILRNARGVEILWAIGNSPEVPCPSAERIMVLLELETRQLNRSQT